mgnify:FL=1
MLTLTTRPCKIGPSINTRTEKHGDEDVTALDIPIESVMLDANELNVLLGEPHAHNALFNGGTSPPEPLLRMIRALKLKDKFEDCTVTLLLGLNLERIELANVKLAKVELEPCVGGLTAASFAIQCAPRDLQFAPLLLSFMNHEADIELVLGKRADASKAQPELPLSTFGEGEEPEMSGIGRQIQNAARKRRRRDNDEQAPH